MAERRDLWQSKRMDAVRTILWSLPSIIFGLGTVITIVALRRAPDGSEDEEGFQYLRSSHTPLPPQAREPADAVHPSGAHLA